MGAYHGWGTRELADHRKRLADADLISGMKASAHPCNTFFSYDASLEYE